MPTSLWGAKTSSCRSYKPSSGGTRCVNGCAGSSCSRSTGRDGRPRPSISTEKGADFLSRSAAVYAAQAAELLVAAIARSDGTRASVSSELLKARVDDGLLGRFVIDPDGDPVPAPVTIVRLEHGGGSDAVANYQGARVDRVITPSRRLLGQHD